MASEAAPSSSSSSAPLNEEEDLLLLHGSESGWVEARTRCDHLASLSLDLAHIPTPDTPCYRCQHPDENWLCLCCKDVLCSRFVNKHMLQHHQQSNHCLALSYSLITVKSPNIRALIFCNGGRMEKRRQIEGKKEEEKSS
ncbi:uncharacterized protein LOC133882781 isoform X4 [Alnus glutinosa]|uniref:uncharacterized protein LOC133882781 isoform X4 n=1 Tax=Alnus glutinosa TaxID=3517 RepID=UPI002D76CFFB|nr:uncharacterized protein LOC133882781 isoform X4 [Alnus glutinosa]